MRQSGLVLIRYGSLEGVVEVRHERACPSRNVKLEQAPRLHGPAPWREMSE